MTLSAVHESVPRINAPCESLAALLGALGTGVEPGPLEVSTASET